MLTVGSLFAGVGGLDLGLERAGMTVKWQVEIEDYPTEVLELRWSETEKFRDIRDFNATLSQAGFHVQEYQMRESAPDYQTHVLHCGGKCYKPFAWYDQGTSSWRTWQHSLKGEWVRFLGPWPLAGMIRNGIAYQRYPLGRSIDVIGSSSSAGWPTPNCADVYTHKLESTQHKEGSKHSVTLAQAVMFPTPTTTDAKGRAYTYDQGNHDKPRASLTGIARMFPTPRGSKGGVGMCGGTGSKQMLDRLREDDEITDLEHSAMQSGSGGQLNPAWVEWLMGFPPGWTDLKPSETPSSPRSPSSSEAGSSSLIGEGMG